MPPGWEEVDVSAYIQTPGWSRAWYFGSRGTAIEFLFETETYHSPTLVTSLAIINGRPFFEDCEIEYVTRSFSGWRQGYRVTRHGTSGSVEISLGEAQALAKAWWQDRVGRQAVDPEQPGPGTKGAPPATQP